MPGAALSERMAALADAIESELGRLLPPAEGAQARLLEAMELAGLVGPLQSNGSREVLVPARPED